MSINHSNIKNPYDLNTCKFLGEGHNGAVYMLPDGKAIKISFNSKDFIREYEILEKVNGNKYFPHIYEVGEDYMIRDCVQGELLSKYIKQNGLKESLAIKIIDMLKEFEKLNFKKIDVRLRDVFLMQDGNLMIIDPQNFYTKKRFFPRHLAKGLYKLGELEKFQRVLKKYDKKLYGKWNREIKSYIKQREYLIRNVLPRHYEI